MKIFLDTADVAEIREYAATGLVDGVTTNPSLAAKTGRDYGDVLKEICSVVFGSVSAEVLATDFDGMMKEGKAVAKIAKNITIKVPLTWDGLKACRALSDDGLMVNVTLCFSPVQAMLAAKAGAVYVSPFIGRIDDTGWDGLELIAQIANIYSVQHYTTQILAASIRNSNHIIQCAELGAHVCTCPLEAILGLLKHPLTDIGLAKFMEDAKKSK